MYLVCSLLKFHAPSCLTSVIQHHESTKTTCSLRHQLSGTDATCCCFTSITSSDTHSNSMRGSSLATDRTRILFIFLVRRGDSSVGIPLNRLPGLCFLRVPHALSISKEMWRAAREQRRGHLCLAAIGHLWSSPRTGQRSLQGSPVGVRAPYFQIPCTAFLVW